MEPGELASEEDVEQAIEIQRQNRMGENPTLRDKFAMAALSGLMSPRGEKTTFSFDLASSWSYLAADAMLVARKQR